MTAPDENNNILFYSRMDIMLHPSLPQVEEYIRATLNTFFQIKATVRAEYQNVNTEQQKQQKERRREGFYLPEDDEKDNGHE